MHVNDKESLKEIADDLNEMSTEMRMIALHLVSVNSLRSQQLAKVATSVEQRAARIENILLRD